MSAMTSDVGPYAILPRWLMRNPLVGPYELAVYAVLADHADRDRNSSFPSHATIAEIAGCSSRKVRDSLAVLAEVGAVNWDHNKRSDGGFSSNTYTIRISDPSAHSAGGSASGADGGSAHSAGGDRHEVPTKKNQKEEEPDKNKNQQLSLDQEVVWTAYLDSWEREVGKGVKPKFSAKRKAYVASRLKEGYTVEELVLAVTGWEHSDWHKGDNPQGKPYNEFERFVKTAEQVEKFIGYHEAKKPTKPGNVNDAHGRERRASGGIIELDDDEDFIDD